MKAKTHCGRCSRERYTDRMQPGRYGGRPAWLCSARTSCKAARRGKARGSR